MELSYQGVAILDVDVDFEPVTRVGHAMRDVGGTHISLFFDILILILKFFSHGVLVSYLNTRILKLGAATAGLLKFLGLTRLNVDTTVSCALCAPLFRGSCRAVGRVITIRN